MRVVTYSRKSKDDSEDTQTSLNNQNKLMEDVALSNGWTIVKKYVDANLSGSDRTRKEFIEMINFVKSSDINIIMVKDQDRFARDSAFFQDTLYDLDLLGKKVFSCMKNDYLSYSDLGDNVGSLMDERYIIKQRQKAQILMEQKKKDLKPTIPAPFGYKYDKDKNWVIDNKSAKIVLKVISDYLNSRDYRATIKENKLTKSKYYRIINNAKNGLYSGTIKYNRKYRNKNKQVIRTEEISYKGNQEPIISEELIKCL